MLHIALDYMRRKVFIQTGIQFCSYKHAACMKPVCAPGTVARSTHALGFGWRAPTESISRIYY
jgi:hypothetical protein